MKARAASKSMQQGLMVWLAVKSVGRYFSHNAVSDLIKRALASAETPAI